MEFCFFSSASHSYFLLSTYYFWRLPRVLNAWNIGKLFNTNNLRAIFELHLFIVSAAFPFEEWKKISNSMKEGTKKSVRKEKMPKKKRNDIKHFLLPPSRVAYWHFGISFAFKWMPALTPSQHWRWIFFSNCVKSIFIISASSFPLCQSFRIGLSDGIWEKLPFFSYRSLTIEFPTEHSAYDQSDGVTGA